jgi:hypothetical protein
MLFLNLLCVLKMFYMYTTGDTCTVMATAAPMNECTRATEDLKLFAFDLAGQERQSSRFPVQISRLRKFYMNFIWISNVCEREISSALFLSLPTQSQTASRDFCTRGQTCFFTRGQTCFFTRGLTCFFTRGQTCFFTRGQTCFFTRGQTCLCLRGQTCFCRRGQTCSLNLVKMSCEGSLDAGMYAYVVEWYIWVLYIQARERGWCVIYFLCAYIACMHVYTAPYTHVWLIQMYQDSDIDIVCIYSNTSQCVCT